MQCVPAVVILAAFFGMALSQEWVWPPPTTTQKRPTCTAQLVEDCFANVTLGELPPVPVYDAISLTVLCGEFDKVRVCLDNLQKICGKRTVMLDNILLRKTKGTDVFDSYIFLCDLSFTEYLKHRECLENKVIQEGAAKCMYNFPTHIKKYRLCDAVSAYLGCLGDVTSHYCGAEAAKWVVDFNQQLTTNSRLKDADLSCEVAEWKKWGIGLSSMLLLFLVAACFCSKCLSVKRNRSMHSTPALDTRKGFKSGLDKKGRAGDLEPLVEAGAYRVEGDDDHVWARRNSNEAQGSEPEQQKDMETPSLERGHRPEWDDQPVPGGAQQMPGEPRDHRGEPHYDRGEPRYDREKPRYDRREPHFHQRRDSPGYRPDMDHPRYPRDNRSPRLQRGDGPPHLQRDNRSNGYNPRYERSRSPRLY